MDTTSHPQLHPYPTLTSSCSSPPLSLMTPIRQPTQHLQGLHTRGSSEVRRHHGEASAAATVRWGGVGRDGTPFDLRRWHLLPWHHSPAPHSAPSSGRVQSKLNRGKCTHASERHKCLVDSSYPKRHVPVETCHTLGEGDRWRRETCYLNAGMRTSEYKLAIFKFCQNITIRLLAIRTEMLEHYSKTIFGSKTLTILRQSMTI